MPQNLVWVASTKLQSLRNEDEKKSILKIVAGGKNKEEILKNANKLN